MNQVSNEMKLTIAEEGYIVIVCPLYGHGFIYFSQSLPDVVAIKEYFITSNGSGMCFVYCYKVEKVDQTPLFALSKVDIC